MIDSWDWLTIGRVTPLHSMGGEGHPGEQSQSPTETGAGDEEGWGRETNYTT